jgi:hypothetical protein
MTVFSGAAAFDYLIERAVLQLNRKLNPRLSFGLWATWHQSRRQAFARKGWRPSCVASAEAVLFGHRQMICRRRSFAPVLAALVEINH